ncbi:MAG: metallophosphoesterase [Verrucomicrobia bacterium]|nr:metallophosphoesterase [Verrucomicrobiota bacterium]
MIPRAVSFRRLLLPALCYLAGSLPAAPTVDFLHLTDTHVTDLREVAEPIAKARVHFKDTGPALEKFLGGEVRALGVDLVLITGDLIDGFSFVAGDGRRVHGQIDAFLRATRPCPVPLFALLGNHDLSHYGVSAAGKPAADQSVAGEARAAWGAAVPSLRQGTYTAFTQQAGETKYHFVLLDNGYSAAGSDDKGGFRMAHEQLFWLRRQMETSGKAVKIVALHVPLGADANSQAIKAELARAPQVALVLAGHVHKDGIDDLALGESKRTVQVRTHAFGYGVNHWRRVRLHADRIEVFATGSRDRVERTIASGR